MMAAVIQIKAGSPLAKMIKVVGSKPTFLLDLPVFYLPQLLLKSFFCQFFIEAFNYSPNLFSLNPNSENMTYHLSSSSALAGAASKRVKPFFSPSTGKKISKRGKIFYLCSFFFLSLKDRKERGKKVILKQRSISTGLPSRTFGSRLIFQGCFLTTELPQSFH